MKLKFAPAELNIDAPPLLLGAPRSSIEAFADLRNGFLCVVRKCREQAREVLQRNRNCWPICSLHADSARSAGHINLWRLPEEDE